MLKPTSRLSALVQGIAYYGSDLIRFGWQDLILEDMKDTMDIIHKERSDYEEDMQEKKVP